MKSCVLIVSDATKSSAEALSYMMGWSNGGESYTIPLSIDREIVTHWGLHTWVTDDFIAMIAGAMQGQVPQTIVDAGVEPEQFVAIMADIIVSIDDGDDPASHFTSVLDAHGLQRISEFNT